MADAVRSSLPTCNLRIFPLADGGEGTLDALVPALGGRMEQVTVQDPLGRPVSARIGLAGETAVVEVAEACGLGRLRPEERHPLSASSYGVGQLLLAARQCGCRHFLVGLGGSATCDGGLGMMQVPGIREALAGCQMELLCDVDAPFVGPTGAARVFAPQKGATPQEVEQLEARLVKCAKMMADDTGLDVSYLPGAGAAGGLSGALMAYFGARKESGIGRILTLLGFDADLPGADLVITGEGQSDRQTLQGKAALGVLHRAGTIPVALVSGRIQDRAALQSAGFQYLEEVTPATMPQADALNPATARQNLRSATLRLLNGEGPECFWGRSRHILGKV